VSRPAWRAEVQAKRIGREARAMEMPASPPFSRVSA